MASYIPVLTALVSALALLAGYAFQKRKEREFEIHRMRQDIYTRLLNNLMSKLLLFEQLRREKPDLPQRVSREQVAQLEELIRTEYPELQRSFGESREIGALMAMYGSDSAIKAYTAFQRQGLASLRAEAKDTPDPALLILGLRKSLFSKTDTTKEEIGLLISD